MKVIIAGGRDMSSEEHYADLGRALMLVVDGFHLGDHGQLMEVVSGGAPGMDLLGEIFAGRNGLKVTRFLADWSTHGAAAGPMRNREMAAYADFAVVVWDGKSRGSANMLEEMRKAGKPALSWIVR